ncbi:MAG: hypothetical protein J6T96_14720 [Bacteroidales bacterium]|nr:hypothetical protein [Bacteroidales bacterium]
MGSFIVIIVLTAIIVKLIWSAFKTTKNNSVNVEEQKKLEAMRLSEQKMRLWVVQDIDSKASSMFRTVMGYDYFAALCLYPDIPFQSNYPWHIGKNTENVLGIVINFLFPEIYLSYLNGCNYEMISEPKLIQLCENFTINVYQYINTYDTEVIQNTRRILVENDEKLRVEKERREKEYWNEGGHNYRDLSWLDCSDFKLNLPNPYIAKETAYHIFYEKYLRPQIVKVLQYCPTFLNNRLNAIDPQMAYQYSIGKVTAVNVFMEKEMNCYLANRKDAVGVVEKKAYENDDMRRIKQVLDSIPYKMYEIGKSGKDLLNKSQTYVNKGSKIIETSYGNILRNNNVREDYYNIYDEIYERFSHEINPVVATACDASIKKIRNFVAQQLDLANKYIADLDKYEQLQQRLQKQYDDEFALQKIKEINRDLNNQMEDETDIAKKEERNYTIQQIISEIDLLDKEVDERRHYEIQLGIIDI